MKYGALETDKTSTPAADVRDWMIKIGGKYVLRIQRKTYIKAREDAASILKLTEWGTMQVISAGELLKAANTRSGVRRAIRRVPYVTMPKPSKKPNVTAALLDLNMLLSQYRMPKDVRILLFRVTQHLLPSTHDVT